MTEQNKKMKLFLRENGIDAMPKYIKAGSLGGTWRIYNYKMQWWNNKELQEKMHGLGFRDFDGQPLSNLSGNGGLFSIFTHFNF